MTHTTRGWTFYFLGIGCLVLAALPDIQGALGVAGAGLIVAAVACAAQYGQSRV